MIRTVISLPETEKHWLDQQAAREGTTMTEIVRQAVRALREARQSPSADFEALLSATAGLWQAGDGLAWQEAQRSDWERISS